MRGSMNRPRVPRRIPNSQRVDIAREIVVEKREIDDARDAPVAARTDERAMKTTGQTSSVKSRKTRRIVAAACPDENGSALS